MTRFIVAVAAVLTGLTAEPAWALDPYAGNDPYWILIHEPAVHSELKLSREQAGSLQKLTDELDLQFFPLRNQPEEQAKRGAANVIGKARDGAGQIFSSQQRKRLNEILLQRQGSSALLLPEVIAKLNYTSAQQEQIEEIVNALKSAVEATQNGASGGNSGEKRDRKLRSLQSDQQKKLLEILKPAQRTAFSSLFGAPFDLTKLGRPAFKAPELIDSGEWINSEPLKLEALRGKVVVLHFYAFGCINCIHNYPSYREWSERFEGKDVAIIGIHTPETSEERDSTGVRRKAAAEKFTFPILIDGKGENWNAWGNSMWPAVYVIDQRGYLRHFWPGELKWQGADGDRFMRERIEDLLATPKS